MRNRKAPLQDEIDRLKKERKQELRQKGLNPSILESTFNEKGIPLHIDNSIRVGLNVNPSEYERNLEIAKELGNYFKIEGDPSKSQFYKDCAEIVVKLVYLVKQKRDELNKKQSELDIEREHWRLKNE